MPKTKTEITQTLIDSLPPGHDITLEFAMSHWWVNIRANSGLRLTDLGYMVLSALDLPRYSVNIDPEKFNRVVMLELDKKLRAPYYIETKKRIPKKLVMFSSREAMLAGLYGDLGKFLKNY
jgi:hypothetical protein